MKEKAERESNIELLRILAMFMIIIFHIGYYCVRIQLNDAASIARWNNGWFCEPVFFPRLLLLETTQTFGKAADTVFMLISGFFLVQKKSFDPSGQIKKLLGQIAVASILLVLVSFIYMHMATEVTAYGIKISIFNNSFWFAGYYLSVIIFAGLFLNGFLNWLDRAHYLTFLWVLFAVFSIGWLKALFTGIGPGLENFIVGVMLYSLGGYIRKYEPFAKLKPAVLIGCIMVTYAFVWLSYSNMIQSEIRDYLLAESSTPFYQNVTHFRDSSIVSIIVGVCLFELGRRVRVSNNAVINFLSAASFMVYLIHDNNFMRAIWKETDWITLLYSDPVGYILLILEWVIMIYAAGVLAYIIYLESKKLFGMIWVSE